MIILEISIVRGMPVGLGWLSTQTRMRGDMRGVSFRINYTVKVSLVF